MKNRTQNSGPTTRNTKSIPTPRPQCNITINPWRNEVIKTLQGSNPNGSILLRVTQWHLFRQRHIRHTIGSFFLITTSLDPLLEPGEDGRTQRVKPYPGHLACRNLPCQTSTNKESPYPSQISIQNTSHLTQTLLGTPNAESTPRDRGKNILPYYSRSARTCEQPAHSMSPSTKS